MMTEILARLATIALLAGAVVWMMTEGGSTQQQTETVQTEVRVIARQLEDGRIEFGIRHGDEDLLPSSRYFPASVSHNNWLKSTPVSIPVDVPAVTAVRFAEKPEQENTTPSGNTWKCLSRLNEEGKAVITSGVDGEQAWTPGDVAMLVYHAEAGGRSEEGRWLKQCAGYHGVNVTLTVVPVEDNANPSVYGTGLDVPQINLPEGLYLCTFTVSNNSSRYGARTVQVKMGDYLGFRVIEIESAGSWTQLYEVVDGVGTRHFVEIDVAQQADWKMSCQLMS